jgi:ParB family chromosome partitioning protein
MHITSPLDAALDAAIPGGGRPPRAPAFAPGLQRVEIADLHPDPNNLRDAVTDVAELAASIEQAGLLQPIIARRDGDRLVVVCGHRRLAALKRLGWPSVDVVVRREMPPDQVLVAMLAENGQRVALDPIEEARAFNRLKVQDRLTDLQVGQRVGRAQAFVSDRLALLNLSPQEQEEVRAGQRSIVHATRIGRVKAGKVRNRVSVGWHLSTDHPLARRAAARCVKLAHPRGARIGSVACGGCWESVIRADEKQALHDHSARRGECALCGAPTSGVRAAPGAPVAVPGETTPAVTP